MLLVFPSNSGNDALLNKAVNSSVLQKTWLSFAHLFKFLAGWFNNFFASRTLAFSLNAHTHSTSIHLALNDTY